MYANCVGILEKNGNYLMFDNDCYIVSINFIHNLIDSLKINQLENK